jgi:hypothetical protein
VDLASYFAQAAMLSGTPTGRTGRPGSLDLPVHPTSPGAVLPPSAPSPRDPAGGGGGPREGAAAPGAPAGAASGPGLGLGQGQGDPGGVPGGGGVPLAGSSLGTPGGGGGGGSGAPGLPPGGTGPPGGVGGGGGRGGGDPVLGGGSGAGVAPPTGPEFTLDTPPPQEVSGDMWHPALADELAEWDHSIGSAGAGARARARRGGSLDGPGQGQATGLGRGAGSPTSPAPAPSPPEPGPGVAMTRRRTPRAASGSGAGAGEGGEGGPLSPGWAGHLSPAAVAAGLGAAPIAVPATRPTTIPVRAILNEDDRTVSCGLCCAGYKNGDKWRQVRRIHIHWYNVMESGVVKRPGPGGTVSPVHMLSEWTDKALYKKWAVEKSQRVSSHFKCAWSGAAGIRPLIRTLPGTHAPTPAPAHIPRPRTPSPTSLPLHPTPYPHFSASPTPTPVHPSPPPPSPLPPPPFPPLCLRPVPPWLASPPCHPVPLVPVPPPPHTHALHSQHHG